MTAFPILHDIVFGMQDSYLVKNLSQTESAISNVVNEMCVNRRDLTGT